MSARVHDGVTVSEFRQRYHAGPYAWPGGYPLYAVTSDGAALCFRCLKRERRQILEAIRDQDNNGWRVVAFDINYEDASLYCEHCGTRIESAYAEDEAEARSEEATR